MATALTYQAFRTGLTFRDVRRMMWVDDPDPKRWVHKTRGCVLRYWRRLKTEMWGVHTGGLGVTEVYRQRRRLPPIDYSTRTPVRREILHRGRRFTVTYWTKQTEAST